MAYMSVSDAARRLEARPRDISDLFYKRLLRDDLAPIIGGRRMIDESLLDVIRMHLRRAGKPVARAVDTKWVRRRDWQPCAGKRGSM